MIFGLVYWQYCDIYKIQHVRFCQGQRDKVLDLFPTLVMSMETDIH